MWEMTAGDCTSSQVTLFTWQSTVASMKPPSLTDNREPTNRCDSRYFSILFECACMRACVCCCQFILLCSVQLLKLLLNSVVSDSPAWSPLLSFMFFPVAGGSGGVVWWVIQNPAALIWVFQPAAVCLWRSSEERHCDWWLNKKQEHPKLNVVVGPFVLCSFFSVKPAAPNGMFSHGIFHVWLSLVRLKKKQEQNKTWRPFWKRGAADLLRWSDEIPVPQKAFGVVRQQARYMV